MPSERAVPGERQPSHESVSQTGHAQSQLRALALADLRRYVARLRGILPDAKRLLRRQDRARSRHRHRSQQGPDGRHRHYSLAIALIEAGLREGKILNRHRPRTGHNLLLQGIGPMVKAYSGLELDFILPISLIPSPLNSRVTPTS